MLLWGLAKLKMSLWILDPEPLMSLTKSGFRRVATVESVNGDDLKAKGRRGIGNYTWANVSRGFFFLEKNKEQRDGL